MSHQEWVKSKQSFPKKKGRVDHGKNRCLENVAAFLSSVRRHHLQNGDEIVSHPDRDRQDQLENSRALH